MKISGDSVFQQKQKSVKDTGAPLKGQQTKFCWQWFTLGSGEGKAKQNRIVQEIVESVSLEKQMKGQPPGSLCWVTLPHWTCHSSWWEHSPPYGISLGNKIALSSRYTLAVPCGACPLLRSQLLGSECRCLHRLRGCQWPSCVALGWGSFSSLSDELDWHLPLMGNMLVPTCELIAAPLSGLLVATLFQALGKIQERLSCVVLG